MTMTLTVSVDCHNKLIMILSVRRESQQLINHDIKSVSRLTTIK